MQKQPQENSLCGTIRTARAGPILLKARTQGFHGSLIKGHEKTRKRRAMGQLIATKQGREWFGKRRTNQEDEVRKGLCFGKPLASYGHQLDGIAVVSRILPQTGDQEAQP